MSNAHAPMRALILGFGNVGKRVAEILFEERDRFPGLGALELEVVGIATRSRGVILDPEGIDMREVLERIRRDGRISDSAAQNTDLTALIRETSFDVLLELTSLSIERKGSPAVDHVREALRRGKHVVTANKGPCAFAYRELERLAHERDARFLFESAVMDGAPVFGLARRALLGCSVKGFAGILNSTTNFILSQMEEGMEFADALSEAQRRGVAETDPRHDVDGWDAAAKTAVLSNVLMDAGVTPFDVERVSVADVSISDVQAAAKRGERLKVVCRAGRLHGGLQASVNIESVPVSHPFALVQGMGNILELQTDLMAPIRIVQTEPTLTDTAYGVLRDLLELADVT